MINLLLCILLTAYLTLAFKLAGRLGLNNLQVILFNYLTCVITGMLMQTKVPAPLDWTHEPWFRWSLLQGFALILVFNLIAATTQRMGVTVASVSNKLSLVIPFLFSIFLYRESASWLKIAGLALALPAVFLSCWPRGGPPDATQNRFRRSVLLPVALFLGSGFFDTLVKYVEQGFLDDTNYHDYLIASFSVASLAGAITVVMLMALGKMTFQWKTIPMGLAIGIPNYFSLWFLMRVLKSYPHHSSTIIPINNTGVVIFSTVAAAFLYQEKLSLQNRWGIVLAIIAMGLLALGSL